MQSGDKLPKRKIEVAVELVDGARVDGVLFVSPQGRILDLLNDERWFLPFETVEGGLTFLRKDAIRRVTPVADAAGAAGAGSSDKSARSEGRSTPPPPPVDGDVDDPYELLGISEEVNTEALREAYRQRCREYHPDRLQALGLPREFLDLATKRMAAINAAYDRIHELRRQAGI
jgi:hypothetical protein